MPRFPDLEAGFEKYLPLAYGRHIITGHLILHSIGLEGGGGTGKEVVLLVAFGDGAYNEAGEGSWGAASEETPGEEGPWFVPSGSAPIWGIVDNKAKIVEAAPGTIAFVEADEADVTVQVIASTADGSNGIARQGLHFRYSDENHFLLWYFITNSLLQLRRLNAGANDVLAEAVVTAAPSHTLKVVTLGDQIEVYHNGSLKATVTETFNQTATKHGMLWEVNGMNPSSIVRFDDFSIQGIFTDNFNRDNNETTLNGTAGGGGGGSSADAVEAVLYAGEKVLTGWHYHPGTISTGELDPLQGVDTYFPGGLTYSATPYMAILLPENMAEDADASKLAVILKTSCIADYDEDGNLTSIGYSPNPARVKADMLKRRGQHTRINWPSYVNARNYYDGLLDWEAGDKNNTYTPFTGVPIYDKSGNITIVTGTGAASKTNPIDGQDNSSTTQERILAGIDGWYRITVSGAFPNGTNGGSIYLVDKNGKAHLGLSWGNGHFSTLANGVAIDEKTEPYPFPASAPVVFELGVDEGFFYIRQDGALKVLPQGPAPAPVDLDLFGRLHLWESSAALSASEFSGRRTVSSTLVTTQVKRFEAHPAFTGPVDLGTALDLVDLYCASDTQDAGSEIIFLTPEPRVSIHIFDEDINVVGFEVHPWQKDVRDRPNRLGAKFRNLDTEFLEQDSVFDLRDELFNEVGRPIDPGPKNFGSMSASQAKRLIKFYMRRESDNYRFCDLMGMHDSVHVLPADVVTVLSHKYSVIVSTGYASGVTSVVLQTGEAVEFRLPPAPFFVTWWNFTDYEHPNQDPFKEIVQVTAVAGDTLTISASAANHNIAGKLYHLGRIPKDFLVLGAGRQSFETSPLNRDFALHEYYPDDYRDTDHEEHQMPVPPQVPSPFSCPPTPVLSLEQSTVSGVGGFVTKIIGTIHFGIHPHSQAVKIYVTKGSGIESFTGLIVEPASGTTTGTFEYTPGEPDVYSIRAEVFSGATVCGSAVAVIVIGDVLINPTNGENLIDPTDGDLLVAG